MHEPATVAAATSDEWEDPRADAVVIPCPAGVICGEIPAEMDDAFVAVANAVYACAGHPTGTARAMADGASVVATVKSEYGASSAEETDCGGVEAAEIGANDYDCGDHHRCRNGHPLRHVPSPSC